MAFILAFVAVGTIADPETVEGLLKKKNVNSWQERQEQQQQQQQQVPIVAKKPNENQLTKVVGGYPQFTPDTLARPLKTTHGRSRPFGQYLPHHIQQWLGEKGRSSTMKPEPIMEKPVQRSFGFSVTTTEASVKAKLIQRPSYNPQLASLETELNSTVNNKRKNGTFLTSSAAVVADPKVAAVIIDDYMTSQKEKLSIAGLVIGLTFVAAFIGSVIGLLGHGLIKRCRRHSNDSGSGSSQLSSSRNSWMRSPGDEDRTPPELRPGSTRSSGRTRHIPGTLPGHNGTPFFNGKLILHDPPGLANGARGVAARPFNPGNVLGGDGGGSSDNGFMMSSPPSKLGAIPKKMPSPAAQVTDVLVSPKYDDDETTEEEDSDDTVYECPGLAATKAMEVRNPFFLEGGAADMVQPAATTTGGLANKKPISQYTDLFHHQEIIGLN